MRVGVVGHRGYTGLAGIMGTLLRVAPELGMRLSFERGLHELANDGEPLTSPDGLDALLTLGGDGTMLRGARFLAGRPVPVFGVNLGRLGFLTTCGATEMEESLTQFAAGNFRAEERMALEARVTGPTHPTGDRVVRHFALNDVVLHKAGYARVVRLDVAANDEKVASYAADGIVISTPTGSTAYSLSAGGPVVVPTVESILLTPISPHTLAIRPLVLPPTAEITLRADVGEGNDEMLVTVDGQPGSNFTDGDTLVVRRAKPVRLVRIPSLDTFFSRLRAKLGWGGLAGRGERDDRDERDGQGGLAARAASLC
ncbi:MAG TPA: NAD(+)/NADH kinase [Gemmatimonadaceae bacterium]|nr:NAD(+)/NADH kinase [Gemmatimonadaceae bacterium]